MNTQLARNLVSTARLIVSNVSDDPSYFALQSARKFRNNVVVKSIDRILGQRTAPLVARSFSAMLRDDKADLHMSCQRWLSDSDNGRGAVFLANLCTASGDWAMAEELLKRATPSAASVRARARLAWALGNMRDAIRILTETSPGRQAKHYASEALVFRGQEPKLAPLNIPGFLENLTQKVVFLATNSLPHTGSGYAQRTQSVLSALGDQGWVAKAATRVNYPLNIGQINASMSDTVGSVEYERLIPSPAKHDLAGRIQQQSEELLKKVLRERPSVLHTTTDFSNALAVKAVSDATGIPWIYEVRGQLADTWLSTRPASASTSERYRLFMEREASAARAANHVFTLGQAMKDNLVDAGVDASKISIVPNAVGETFLEAPAGRRDSRLELGLNPDAFYVGTVSSLVPYEGLSVVVEAVAALSREFSDLRLLVVGDGTDRENLLRLAEKLGIADRCEFPGRVPRGRAHLYHAALNVFVVPRIDSAVTRSVTPLKPVEAMASGVPVLASDLPALRELIVDGENGHLVEPENVGSWVSAIRNLIEQPELCSHLGKSGREFVLENRTWQQNAQKIVEVYEQVISKAS